MSQPEQSPIQYSQPDFDQMRSGLTSSQQAAAGERADIIGAGLSNLAPAGAPRRETPTAADTSGAPESPPARPRLESPGIKDAWALRRIPGDVQSHPVQLTEPVADALAPAREVRPTGRHREPDGSYTQVTTIDGPQKPDVQSPFLDYVQEGGKKLDERTGSRPALGQGVRRWGRATAVATGLTAAAVGGVIATHDNPGTDATHQVDRDAENTGTSANATEEPTHETANATPPGESSLGQGYGETMRERAANVSFTTEEGKEVFRMDQSQTPLEKLHAAAHNFMVGPQSDDTRLADVMGIDARTAANDLVRQYGDSLWISPTTNPTEMVTEQSTVIRGEVALNTSGELPIQGMRAPDIENHGTYTAEIIFIDPDHDGRLTLAGITLTPAESNPDTASTGQAG